MEGGKEEMAKGVELKRGLTPKVIICGIIITVLVATTSCHEVVTGGYFRDASFPYMMGPELESHVAIRGYYMFSVMTWVLVFCAVVNSIKPVFSKQEVGILLLFVMIPAFIFSGSYSNIGLWLAIAPGIGFTPAATQTLLKTVLPDILGPKDPSYWAKILPVRTLAIDWGPLVPTISWYTIFVISTIFSSMFFVLGLFRRLFVDVESLQFPIADISSQLVDMTQSQETSSRRAKFFKSKWFLIGLIVQAVWFAALAFPYQLPAIISGNYTSYGQGPGIGQGFIGSMQLWPEWQNQQLSTAALPWVLCMVYLTPWQIGWAGILSTDVLVGCIIGWLALWVFWPLISSGMGLLPAYTPGGREFSIIRALESSAPAGGNLVSVQMGLLVSLALLPLVVHRRTIKPILMGIVKEPSSDFDPHRPIPYRAAWWGFIISFIVMLACTAAMGVMVLPTLICYLIMIVFMMGYVRVIAETGGNWGTINERFFTSSAPYGFAGALIIYYFFKDVFYSPTPSTAALMTYTVCLTPVAGAAIVYQFHSGGMLPLNAFKISSITKADNKDTLKALLIAVVVATVTAIIAWYLLLGWMPVFTGEIFAHWIWTYLAANWMARTVGWQTTGTWFLGPTTGPLGQPGDIAMKFIAGIAVAILITFMRGKFTWFRISLAGVVLGAMVGWKLWSPFLVALIIKQAALRVGGTKVYEEKLRPLFLGFFTGYMLVWLFYGVVFEFWWIAMQDAASLAMPH